MLADLRKTIQRLEQPMASTMDRAANWPIGIAAVDLTLGGGLSGSALHEIAAASERHVAVASGFALGLVPRNRMTLWASQDMTLIESGALCGSGIDSFAQAPEQLLTVATARTRDLLWTMEEALRCRAVGAVIGELRDEHVDPVALRRLSLAAAANGTVALLLRSTPKSDASTAATRWIVGAAPSRPCYGPGPPRMNAQLVRNRRGTLGSWVLEWSNTDEHFVLASTHPQPVARPFIDRSNHAAVA